MDIKIKDGDMVLDKTGSAVYVYDCEEVFQRALFILSTAKGAFIYNKDMGVEAVTSACGERFAAQVESVLREAVSSVEGLTLYLQSAEELIDGRVKALVNLEYRDKEQSVEVIIDADL